MRKVFAIVIAICLIYFVGGYAAVWYQVISRDEYFAYAGIVGGLASVAGLLALTRPAITQNDIQSIEVNALKSMTRTAEELRDLQVERSKTEEEIGSLSLRKKEMELLVRKASLAIFLREQMAHYERRILDEVSKNSQLQDDLEKVRAASEKLSALNEEIKRDPNVEYLQRVISDAGARQPTLSEAIAGLPPLFRAVLLGAEVIARALSATLGLKVR